MGRVADPKLVASWQKRVERQLRSGLSVQEYCRREGFSTASFYAWKQRLRSPQVTASKPVRRRVSDGPPRPGGFVQVPLAASSALEVCFSDGTTVRVPAEHLAVTLKLLKAQSEGASDD